MKIVGIISEYNPFHKGHAYQIEYLRDKVVKDGAVVAVMSGSFTQRGELSSMDKWARAKSAIQNGVDLVIELPTVFSISSADGFASGGVKTLAACQVIGQMAFGSEAADIKPLREIAKTLVEAENDGKMKEHMSKQETISLAYAAAVSSYIEGTLGQDYASMMKESNNILGISYLKTIESLDKDNRLKAITHERVGQSHLDSATKIRGLIKEHKDHPASLIKALSGHVPVATIAALYEASKEGTLLTPSNLGPLAFSLLRSQNQEQISSIAGMNDGLAKRLVQSASRLTDPNNSLYEQLILQSKAKHLSTARVQRALAALVLNISDAEMKEHILLGPQYIRVLAFNRQGRYVLKLMSKYASLPIISKGSDFREHNDKGELFKRQYELDLSAADIRDALCRNPVPGRDFDMPLYIR